MGKPCRILALEDRPEDVELAERELKKGLRPFLLQQVDSRDTFREALRSWNPDLILCDFTLPGFDGLTALSIAKEEAPEVPVIMYTGTVSEETAVLCLKAGADDYILKDNPARLQAAVESALKARREREEKDRAQAALAASEERFRRLVETADDAIVAFGSDGTIEFLNPAGEFVFGYAREEARGMNIRSLIGNLEPGPLEDYVDAPGEERGRSGPPEALKLVGRRKDGSEFPMEVSLSGYREGGSHRFTAIIRDTSERTLARETIESLSRQHELLLNSAGEGILGLDTDCTVSFVNPAAETLLGRPARELLGRELHPLIQDYSKPEARAALEDCSILRAHREGTPFRGELVFLREDGSSFPAEVSFTPIEERGERAGAVMVFEDITQRKAAEAALRTSEERYRSLVENAMYGIYQSSLDGKLLAVNPALVEMLGYDSKEELMAVDMARDLYEDEVERGRLVKAFKDTNHVMGAETRWLRKDGTPVTVRLSGRGIWDEDGEFKTFEVMVEDLTERRTLEEQLRQAQKMEAVGQLTGGIAHDFNNVLSVILLNSELLASAVETGDEIDVADLHAIHDSAKRATSITRKLLGFSRQAELLMEPTHLGRVVSNISTMLRTLLPETIDLKLDIGDLPGPSLVDAGSVEQMLLNLVGNSRDAMPGGGRVRVSVNDVELDEEYASTHAEVDPGPYVCVEVSDNGVGMDEETLKRVFDPFFTTKAPGAGTGLGMAMVYGLTKQQGGHVSIYSHVGEGTTTRLYFPLLAAEKAEEKAEAAPAVEDSSVATLLLVEDEENLRTATRRALERRGFTVITASDGEEALDLFRERAQEFDLVLSDLVLPRMGGGELMRKVKAEFGPVPFVLTSGYSGEEAAARGIGDDSVPFIRKPWVLKDLLTLIRATIETEAPAQETTNG